MTDPNLPPERVVVEPERHTTVNVQPERRGGGAGMAFLVGGLLVVVAIIAFVLFSGGGNPVQDAADTNVAVDVNLPSLPDAPRMPDIEPPTLPTPAPAPAN
jgi:hypothetical protein